MRILKVSSTKKTILINRGIEDGLVEEDHAKFYLTTGIIARGVVVKASPSRSVWSLYRLVEPDKIIDKVVINLKISSPVRVTDDSTRSLSVDGVANIEDKERIALPVSGDRDELNFLRKNTIVDHIPLYDPKGKWEIWGMLNYKSDASTTETTTSSVAGTSTSTSLKLGLERYFFDSPKQWVKRTSFSTFLSIDSSTADSGTAQSVNSITNLGVSGSFHFLHTPNILSRFIPYGEFGAGLGRATTSSGGSDLSGSSNFSSFGGGVKYFLDNHLGGKMVVEYLSQGMVFASELDTIYDTTVTTSGLRVGFGISYAW